MTEKSKKPAEKKQAEKKVRKVTTGAWWKSSKKVQDESKKDSSVKKQDGAEKKAPKPKPKPKAKVKAKTKAVKKTAVVGKKQSGKSESVKTSQAKEKQVAPAEKEQAAESSRQKPKQKKASTRKSASQKTTGKQNEPAAAGKKGNSKPEQTGEKGKKTASGNKKGPGGRQKTRSQSPASKARVSKAITKLLINAEEPEECRIAQVENGRLESYHVNTVVQARTKNNIYKGRIVSVEASLQAAFVDIGTGRNGFLPFSDIHPEYYKEDVSEKSRALISQQKWRKLKIEDVVKRGQEVLVQVVKEVTGNKGANMTTYLSMPGRCLVLMPGSDSAGISRKISGEERRSQLREIMSKFSIPEGIGFIVRTASAEITKTALQQDLRFLLGLWKEIKKRGQTVQAPALIYQEQDTVVRFLRDHFVTDISEIIVDTQESFEQVKSFVELLPARQRKVQVKLHRGSKPIFNQNNIEEQIESIYQPQVQLPSGGSIVIDPTEALVAIDVNSGRTSQKGDFEKSIFLANMEAADELARQLRLRDLGGLVVVDFIDMRNKRHIKDVERQVKSAMKRDKAKVDISRISRFGLMQISRQKMGAPIEKGSYRQCGHCQGRGVVRSVETLALYYLRRIQTGISRKKIQRVEARLPLEVGQYLLNKKRTELTELENKHHAAIDIIPRPEMKPHENTIDFLALPVANGKDQS